MSDTQTYTDAREAGEEFQDLVATELCRQGIPILSHCSRKYQYATGESIGGFEIKLDRRFTETRNIYIETAEKKNAGNASFVASGIYRTDNSWMWVIGNEEILFFLPKNILVLAHKSGIFKEVQTPTSKGFLLPEVDARKYAAKIITMESAA